MGFMGPEEALIKQLNLSKDPRLNIDTPPNKYNTSVPRVYAAGGRNIICLKYNLFKSL